MTAQEAIGMFKTLNQKVNPMSSLFVADCMAISALEKQIPKKPIGTEVDLQWGTVKCPSCGKAFCTESWKREWCCECGQRLLWESDNQ